ncbi:putative methyltransferase DDB_G0268948 [Lissotriton helveticus]
METRLFEEEEHASLYQKYRFSMPPEIKNLILSYLEEKKGKPFMLAVDVGCGTGQSTRVLAPHFQKVVGVDISEAQINEAKKVVGPKNISYCVCPAEDLPFEDGSVDLVMASAAVHYFNIEKFMTEVNRVLKPCGCVALLTYTQYLEVHEKECSDQLTAIYNEVEKCLVPFHSKRMKHVNSGYQEIFDAIPFPDKTRLGDAVCFMQLSVADLLGFIQSLAMFQAFLKKEPAAAKALLRKTEQRWLEAMGVSSKSTMVEIRMQYICVLACKPD